MKLKTAVLLSIFNRPDTTDRVFAEIRKAEPAKLFVVADGPRENVSGEVEKCAETRAIIDKVDWDCELYTRYSDVNLGMNKCFIDGMYWMFEKVDRAIIFEHDCVPNQSFFNYCEELLEYYKDDERVMHISGNNFQFGRKRTDYSYYFSKYTNGWGFATWSRAYKHLDFELKKWPEFRDSGGLESFFSNSNERRFWEKRFQDTYDKKIGPAVDRSWFFTCLINSGFSIIPSVNLVSYIGFSPEATHTKDTESKLANVPAIDISLPLHHPPFVFNNAKADAFLYDLVHSRVLFKFIIGKVKNFFN